MFCKTFLEPTAKHSAKHMAIGDSKNNIYLKRPRKNIIHFLVAIFPLLAH